MGWSWYYLIPLIYFAAMIYLGVAISSKQETRSDFYVASNKMNSGVLFATIFSTVIGANVFMGFSGMIYSAGFSQIWFLSAAGLGYFLLFFISGKLRRVAFQYNIFTLPDMMELRYSKTVALLTTAFSLIALIGMAGGSILGVGVILNSILGIDITLAIIITSAVTIIYTSFGGIMGVALTDYVQSIIMVLGVVLVITFGLTVITGDINFFTAAKGGVSVLEQTLGSQQLNLTSGITIFLVIGWVVTFMPLNTISQTQLQRVYAAKNEKTIQRISLMMVLMNSIFMCFGLALVGMLGKMLMPGLENPETVFPMMALEVINPFLGMIVVTGILAAAMSTVDSSLLGAGIHVSRDLYERYQKDKAKISDQSSLKITRVTIVIIGVISTLAAIITPSIMDLLLTTMQIFAGATFIPVLLGVFWKRANAYGAMLGMILGGISTIYAEIVPQLVSSVIIGSIVSFIGVIVGSLLTRAEVEKGMMFKVKTVKGQEWVWFFAVLIFYVLFMIGLSIVKMWAFLIVMTVIALITSIIILLIHILPRNYSNM